MTVARAVDLLKAGAAADVAEAVSLLANAARSGDPEGSNRLATLAAAGIGMRKSWSRAMAHLCSAALAGSASARGQLRAMASDRRLAEANDSAPNYWRALSAHVNLEDWIRPCEKRVLNASPRTVAIEAFILRPVCDWIISCAAGRLQPALTYAEGSATAVRSEGRNNSALELGLIDCDVAALLLRQRIAATIGVPAGALETSQVLHYAVGEQFARHYDYLDPSLPEVAERGQRIVTFLVYLNDAFDGGETDFPHLRLRHRGKTGDALYFGNLGSDGAPDTQTLHAGLPPTSGEKWLFSQWIRNQARV